jgi:hypothetical protein
MFAWSSVEMPGVTREVTGHTLNIKLGSRPVKSGLRRFNQEKHQDMGKELSRILATALLRKFSTRTGSQFGSRAQKEQKVVDVRGLHKREQGMPEGSFPSLPDQLGCGPHC